MTELRTVQHIPLSGMLVMLALFGFFFGIVALFIGFLIAAFTGSFPLGLGLASVLWFAALAFTFWKAKQKAAKPITFTDTTCTGTKESFPLSEIGHVSFNGKHIFLQRAWEGTAPRRSVAFSPPDPETFYQRLVEHLKECQLTFTADKNGVLETHGELPLPEFPRFQVGKVTYARPAFKEYAVSLDGNPPSYTILHPYSQQRHNYYPGAGLVLVEGEGSRTEHASGKPLLAMGRRRVGAGSTSSAGIGPSGWDDYHIMLMTGNRIGTLSVKRKLISPKDSMKLTVLGEEVAIEGDMADYLYRLSVRGMEVGTAKRAKFSLRGVVAELTLNSKVPPAVAFAMLLAFTQLPAAVRAFKRPGEHAMKAASLLRRFAR